MASRPRVRTRSGEVEGQWIDIPAAQGRPSRAAVFRAIPYAADPVGDLRFAAPAPPMPWDGVRDAAQFGPTPQRVSPYDPPRIPEPSIPGPQTLTVNVTTPEPRNGAQLPVLLWIHGGGFVGGSPASPWYVGESFARDGVVTVTFGYRLGFEGFGWVGGAANTHGGEAAVVEVNRGVLDWIAALEWVQDNIADFGGNPDRVTIAGQSAGGAAVMRLLTMPATHHLFAAVMAISPADASSTAVATKAASVRIAASCGATLACESISAVDEMALFDARDEAREPGGQGWEGFAKREAQPLALGPCVDGELIEASVTQALAAGVGAQKPLLIGSCAHEFNQLVAAAELDSLGPLAAVTRAGLEGPIAVAAAAREPSRGGAWAVGQLLSDAIFRAPVARWSSLRAGANSPTWAYDFRWESGARSVRGAGHCVDVPFGFDILGGIGVDDATGPAPQALADAVHGDWLQFITEARCDAPARGVERQTIVYGADATRSIAAAYELEEQIWAQLRGE